MLSFDEHHLPESFFEHHTAEDSEGFLLDFCIVGFFSMFGEIVILDTPVDQRGKDDSSDEVHSLRVFDLVVEYAVRLQHSSQTASHLLLEEFRRGCAAEIFLDLAYDLGVDSP